MRDVCEEGVSDAGGADMSEGRVRARKGEMRGVKKGGKQVEI